MFSLKSIRENQKTHRFTTVGLGGEATIRIIRQHRRCGKLPDCSGKLAPAQVVPQLRVPALASHPFQRLGEFLQVSDRPSIQADKMRKLTLADSFMATLAVSIEIGYPVWRWISEILLRHSRLP
jgi:hypothetical protein